MTRKEIVPLAFPLTFTVYRICFPKTNLRWHSMACIFFNIGNAVIQVALFWCCFLLLFVTMHLFIFLFYHLVILSLLVPCSHVDLLDVIFFFFFFDV